MAERTDFSAATAAGELLVVERVFDAPRELVWKAWSNPQMVRQWWGPKGVTTPAAELEFRVGGKWLLAVVSPEVNDGKPVWLTGVYKEILPFERIVMTDCFADEEGTVVPASHYGSDIEMALERLITLTFEELGDQTRLTLRHEGLGEMGEGADESWNEIFDKMAQVLAQA